LARIPGSYFLQNLVARRALIYQLARRDFEQRYVGSAAGWVWGLIHPLVLLVSWIFVFQICLKVELPRGEVTQNYVMFLLCGFVPWLLFQETVQRSSGALIDQANLIKKTIFPAEIVPVTVFLSVLISHLLTVVLVILAVGIALHQFSYMIFMLPVYMTLLGLFAVGLGWMVSALNVYLRDTAQVVSVVLTLWFWLTPIFISEEMYPEPVRFLLAWNPLRYVVRAYRDRILSYRLPTFEELAVISAYAVASFVIGGLFFRRLKRGFADVL
jgi:ABC-type polysaccharide/polyol phosphate export permease